MPPNPDLTSPSLLSPANYDGDSSSLRSLSDQDSDSEDDEFLNQTRSTTELANHDRTVLDDEDETEKLLTRQGPVQGLRRILSPYGSRVKIGKNKRRQQRRREARKARRERVSEEGELMYEMEEGLVDDDASSITDSFDSEPKNDHPYEPVSLHGQQ